MEITQVAIPQYSYATRRGNWLPGRIGSRGVREVVIHWTAGNLAGTDATFRDLSRVASAHFGVGEGEVHQYVPILSTAFHAGVWQRNLESFGIEISAQSGRDASDTDIENACQVAVMGIHFLGKRVGEFSFTRHGDIVPTQCCGTIDVRRIQQRCLEIERETESSPFQNQDLEVPQAPAVPAVTASSPVSVPVTTEFWVKVTGVPGVNVRDLPNTRHEEDGKTVPTHIYAAYFTGSEIECKGQVTGESVNGNTVWYVTKNHTRYVSSAFCQETNKTTNQA